MSELPATQESQKRALSRLSWPHAGQLTASLSVA